ncbi:MAG: L,D-transpeptidase/peptidoglycan binding protein [Patescibacteria group bacterium]|nr:L,D-transpeptidase/peptidoglycan binding protein [Patescibacteria group bacterium]
MNNSNTLAVSQKLTKFNSVKFLNYKINKLKLAKISAAFLSLALLASGMMFFNRAYADKIYPKVMVAGVQIGGLTREQAKAKIDEKIKTLNENGPEITYNDQTLKPKLDEMGLTFDSEKLLDQAFNYGRSGSIENKIKENYTLALEGTTIELKPQIDETKFNDYLSQLAKQVEIPSVDKEVEDGTGTVISEGQDGRSADTDTLKAQIKDALAQGQGGSFALATFVTPRNTKTIYPHAQPGRYAGKYIDVNLSEQTLYAFEGSTLVNQFLISSGVRSHPSPVGEFSVYNKTVSQLMDGPDYYLPNVPWISWFSGDYSIHGTYWHHNFGTPMSHGCINASIADAEWIFNWDDVGTPVYLHY